jgi:hypothetical protein
MSDSYIAIAEIASDGWMNERLRACAAQQEHLTGVPVDSDTWVAQQRYIWASSPSWGEKWDYAKATHQDPEYMPGKDPAVITDGDILATVQALTTAP